MVIAHALMGLLRRGERHGYELRRELEEGLGSDWRLDFGQLYRVLASMQSRGWIVGRVEPGDRGPERKVYALTQRGRDEHERWLRQPACDERGRDDLPVKLRDLAGRAGPMKKLVAERRRALEAECRAERLRCDDARASRDVGRWLLAEMRRRRNEATLAALQACEAVAGAGAGRRRPRGGDALIAVGSDDRVLDLLAQHLAGGHPEFHFSSSPMGSLAGLMALRDGRAHLAGTHLLDADSGEYNVPFIKHLMPEETVVLVNLARREQGLMLARGNPKGVRRIGDLARPGMRLINRQPGAGTRLLLHHHLRRAGIDPRSLRGYGREAPTHDAVGAAITAGTADVGPGIRAVADAWGLEFLSLGHERYDLAIRGEVFDSPRVRPLLELLHGDVFRQAASAFRGYDLSHMSEIVARIH